MQRTAPQCHTLQHTTKHCNTQGPALPWHILDTSQVHCNSLQHTATHCNALRHLVIHCNTLKNTATYKALRSPRIFWILLVYTAPHYNTLHHTAPHYNVLQHTAPHYRPCWQFRDPGNFQIRASVLRENVRVWTPSVLGRLVEQSAHCVAQIRGGGVDFDIRQWGV